MDSLCQSDFQTPPAFLPWSVDREGRGIHTKDKHCMKKTPTKSLQISEELHQALKEYAVAKRKQISEVTHAALWKAIGRKPATQP